MNAEANTINREACAWIAKLHDTELTAADREALQAWLRRSPQHNAELRRMAKRWDELNVLTELAVPVELPDGQRLPKLGSFLGRANRRRAIGALAVVSVLIVAVLWAPLDLDWDDSPPDSIYVTAVGEQRLVTLPDNSTVLLNTNSQLRLNYNADFRSVYLIQGEAHFDVVGNANRPFRVFAGNGVFHALGTSFSVHLKERTVELTVTEGRVEIRNTEHATGSNAPPEPEITPRPVVSAGQVAIYDQYVESIEMIAPLDEREISRQLAWQDGLLRFSGDPLADVVNEVSRYTSLSIVILDPQLRELRIGGSFEVGETEKMFEALQSGFGVRVQRIDDSLVHLSLARPVTDDP